MNQYSEFYQLRPKKYTTKLLLSRIHDKEIVFRHGHIAITDYKLGDNFEFEKSLSVFDEMRHKYELKGGYYVKELREFRVNRAYDLGMLSTFFRGYKVRVDNDAYPSDKVETKLIAPPRDDFQRVGLTFMCGQGEYKGNLRYTQQLINGAAGSGKTYLGAAVTCFMQARAVIISPLSKISKQWKETFLDKTDAKKDDVLIVTGSDKCQKIIEGKYPDVKIFIFSADTIGSFNERYGDMETIELFRATKAYIKIVDEIHMEMRLISMIEALSNFHMNFYMSASPGRTARKENWIFKTCFKNMPKFGGSFLTKEELYMNIMIKRYRFVPTPDQQKRMVQARTKWLNTKSYERELITSPEEQHEDFFNAVRSMLRWSKSLLKEGNKILIFSETIAGTEVMKEIAEEVFPGKASQYHGSLKPAEKEEALKSTVICATISSLGTGADIKGIQHVYNITTYTNWISTIQVPARARKLADGTQVWYIEFVNFSFIKTLRQYEKRKPELIKRSRTGKILLVD